MSKFFNYKRAWAEYIKPKFDKIFPMIRDAYEATAESVDMLGQDGSLALVGATPGLIALYDAMPADILALAERVVYYYGHLASDGSAQDGGLYWKFEKLAQQSLFSRENTSELRNNAKLDTDAALEGFHDHEEGTEYSNDELPAHIATFYSGLKILKVANVNHKPDVFCIGSKHMRLSKGMFLDPAVAPCAKCRQSYESHTSDIAAFVDCDGISDDDLRIKLKELSDILKEKGVRVDGFALVKGELNETKD